MTQEHMQQVRAILIAYWKGETPDDTLMFRACGQLARIVLAAMKPRKRSLVRRDPERYRLEIMNLLQRLAVDDPGAAELMATLVGISTPTRQRGVSTAPAIFVQGDYAQVNIGNIADTIAHTMQVSREQIDASNPEEDSTKIESQRLKLRYILTRYFNDSELRNLCFELNIDYESLRGQGKGDRVIELVMYAERHGRTDDLVTLCRRLRPNADWQNVAT
jgi:Effector-associated domain 7